MSTEIENAPLEARTLGRLYEFTYNVTLANLEGVTHEESLVQPTRAGNCINWVFGHLVKSRNGVLKIVGQEPVWTTDDAERYKRGSDPLIDPSEAVSLDRLREMHETSQERFRTGIVAMTEEVLTASIPDDQNPFNLETVGQMLAILNFHETYHAGQLGILRRILGKEGSIS